MAVEIDKASKGLLSAFTIFILGSGLTTIVYGVLLLLRYLAIQYNYGLGNLFVASIALIVIGSLLIIVLILGIYGAWKNVTAVRLVTLVLAFIIFLVLAITGIWTMYVVQTGRLKSSISNEITGFANNFTNLKPELKDKINYMHQNLKCCSVAVNTDDQTLIPDSCCKSPACEDIDGSKYYDKQCDYVYSVAKIKTVHQLSIFTLAACGSTLLGLIFYGILYQRQAHAGYAGVSRG